MYTYSQTILETKNFKEIYGNTNSFSFIRKQQSYKAKSFI